MSSCALKHAHYKIKLILLLYVLISTINYAQAYNREPTHSVRRSPVPARAHASAAAAAVTAAPRHNAALVWWWPGLATPRRELSSGL